MEPVDCRRGGLGLLFGGGEESRRHVADDLGDVFLYYCIFSCVKQNRCSHALLQLVRRALNLLCNFQDTSLRCSY